MCKELPGPGGPVSPSSQSPASNQVDMRRGAGHGPAEPSRAGGVLSFLGTGMVRPHLSLPPGQGVAPVPARPSRWAQCGRASGAGRQRQAASAQRWERQGTQQVGRPQLGGHRPQPPPKKLPAQNSTERDCGEGSKLTQRGGSHSFPRASCGGGWRRPRAQAPALCILAGKCLQPPRSLHVYHRT